jgi:hypothetical protein
MSRLKSALRNWVIGFVVAFALGTALKNKNVGVIGGLLLGTLSAGVGWSMAGVDGSDLVDISGSGVDDRETEIELD